MAEGEERRQRDGVLRARLRSQQTAPPAPATLLRMCAASTGHSFDGRNGMLPGLSPPPVLPVTRTLNQLWWTLERFFPTSPFERRTDAFDRCGESAGWRGWLHSSLGLRPDAATTGAHRSLDARWICASSAG